MGPVLLTPNRTHTKYSKTIKEAPEMRRGKHPHSPGLAAGLKKTRQTEQL